jgi:uncharacterized protein HemY
MMIWILLIALVLILGGVLADLMMNDPGVVLISWQNWMVQTTFWGAVGIALSIVCVFIIFSALWKRFGPVQLLTSYRNRRDRKTAKKETAIAIESWLKGTDDRAIKALQRVADAGGSDRLPMAVSLALGMQQADWTDRYAAFISKDTDLKLFADTLQAERFWQQHKEQDFIDLMLSQFELRQIPWLRDRFWQCMLQSDRAIELITMVNEAANIQPDVRQQWLVTSAIQAFDQSHTQESAGAIILKSLSKTQRNLPDILEAEVRYLITVDKHELAFKRAKLLLSATANRERCAVLLTIQVSNIQKLSLLENMQSDQSGPIFCRVLGILNLRQQLWGNAQSLLEQSWHHGDKSAGVHLAELFEQRNMHDQAARLYKELATGIATA